MKELGSYSEQGKIEKESESNLPKEESKKFEDKLAALDMQIQNETFSLEVLKEAVDLEMPQEAVDFFENKKEPTNNFQTEPAREYFLRIKRGWLYVLGEKYRVFLEKQKSSEKLETIKNVSEVYFSIQSQEKNFPQLRNFFQWSIRYLFSLKNEDAAKDLVLEISQKVNLDHLDYGLAMEIFKNDVSYSQNRILEKLSRNSGKKVIVIQLTDLIGAENSRKKIDETILASEENDEAQNNLCYARAFITPCEDSTAILNLQNFYQDNIKFEEYKVNSAMNERELSLLKSLVEKDGKVLEMGCGTGRLIKELAKDGYDLTGYDFTKRHVEITKSEIEKTGGEAKVFQGDWHENAVKDESLDAVYSLGRNILHDYSIVDQAQLFREASRILKKGGKFIFDIPDREKGGYAQMVKGYAAEMEKRGIRNFRFGSIYDSPDGTHFATRYAYSQEDIEELARLSGLKILDIKRLPLETGQGDENLYYVLEKL